MNLSGVQSSAILNVSGGDVREKNPGSVGIVAGGFL